MPETHTTTHRETRDDGVVQRLRRGDKRATRAAWQYTGLPAHAALLRKRVAFAW